MSDLDLLRALGLDVHPMALVHGESLELSEALARGLCSTPLPTDSAGYALAARATPEGNCAWRALANLEPEDVAAALGVLPKMPRQSRARFTMSRIAGSDELQVCNDSSGYSLEGLSAEELRETLLEIIRGEIAVEVDQ